MQHIDRTASSHVQIGWYWLGSKVIPPCNQWPSVPCSIWIKPGPWSNRKPGPSISLKMSMIRGCVNIRLNGIHHGLSKVNGFFLNSPRPFSAFNLSESCESPGSRLAINSVWWSVASFAAVISSWVRTSSITTYPHRSNKNFSRSVIFVVPWLLALW